jgi:hypothetical protein
MLRKIIKIVILPIILLWILQKIIPEDIEWNFIRVNFGSSWKEFVGIEKLFDYD